VAAFVNTKPIPPNIPDILLSPPSVIHAISEIANAKRNISVVANVVRPSLREGTRFARHFSKKPNEGKWFLSSEAKQSHHEWFTRFNEIASSRNDGVGQPSEP